MKCPAIFTQVFSVAVWAYFLIVVIEICAFIVNAGKDVLPFLKVILPYNLDQNLSYCSAGKFGKVLINVVLLGFFAIPHSIFARPFIKKKIGLPSLYRSIYTLQSSAALHLLLRYWQPVWADIEIWNFLDIGALNVIILILYLLGVLWFVSSTFAFDHFELFGVKQGTGFDIMKRFGWNLEEGAFSKRLHYRFVRHPIMLGIFILLYVTPTMTLNHVIFSVCCTTYILLAVYLLEEPDLITQFGDTYVEYKTNIPAFCPCPFAKLCCNRDLNKLSPETKSLAN